MASQAEAVATVSFLDGITVDVVIGLEPAVLELELDELEELEELEELPVGGGMHGGTMSVATLLLAGSTS